MTFLLPPGIKGLKTLLICAFILWLLSSFEILIFRTMIQNQGKDTHKDRCWCLLRRKGWGASFGSFSAWGGLRIWRKWEIGENYDIVRILFFIGGHYFHLWRLAKRIIKAGGNHGVTSQSCSKTCSIYIINKFKSFLKSLINIFNRGFFVGSSVKEDVKLSNVIL